MARTTSAPGGPSSISSSKGPAIIRSPEKLGNIQYPPNIKSPFADAGANSPSSNMFKYDRGFLMQFMDVCKDKPTNMPSDALDETKGDLARTPSGRRGGGSGRQSLPPRSGMFSPSDMAKMTSEERFAASASANLRQGAGLGRSFSQTGEVRRTPSGGKGLPPKEMERDNRRGGKSGRGRGRGGKGERESHGGPTIPMDQVVPLEKSESAWKVEKTKAAAEAENSPVVVQRKIKALLNKLTLEKFDTISDKIMEFANMSRNEEDGSTLKLVIQLVFEKATDEPNFSSMYAKLAKKMLDDMSDDVVDTSLFGKDGKPLAGGTLFRKYLLNRCQEEFEKGWKVDLPTDPSVDELMSDEYYIAMKAKRRGLGLIQFIGELFKLEMLTERIMHECVRRLLSNVNDPEEEETESLCRLMITVGERLDHVQAKGFMDVYFNRIRDLSTNKKLSSRIRFMLLDLIDMRSNNWVARREAAGPKTIAEIHDEAAKAKEAQDALRRSQSSSGRGMPPMNQQYSNYGSNRPRKDSSVNDKGRPGSMGIPSEWTSVGQTQATPTQAARKPSDMSKFGMLERTKSETASSNPFEALGGGSKGWTDKSAEKKDAAITPKTILKPGGPPGLASAKSGPPGMAVNKFGALNLQSPDSEEPRSDGRPQLKLAPRTVQQAQPVSETKVTKQTVKKKTDEALKEYYSVKDVEELRRCLLELGSPEYMQDAISQMMTVVEKSPADVKAIATAFDRFQKDETVKADVFAKAFEENMLNFVDLEIDVPNMYKYVAQLLVASNIKTKTVQELTQNLPNPGTAKHAAATIFVEYIKLVRESSGEEGLMRRFRFPTVNLRFLFPTSDEYYADFLENNNLFALAPGMKAFKPLKKMIVSEPHEVIMKWLDV
jgi:translation initiation factor 4G